MSLRLLHVIFDACDLGLQCFDPHLQFVDRHRIEVLLCKLDQGIAGLAWEEVIEVHGRNR